VILSTVLTKSFYKRVVLTLCFLLPAWSDIGLGDVKELFPSTIEDPAHWSVLPPNMMAAVDWQRIQEMNYSHPRKTIELIHRLQGQEGRLGPVDQREALLFLLEAHLLLYETHEAATLLDVLRPKLSELDGVQTVRFWGAEGTYAWIVGHSEKGIEALNKSIELARQLGDPRLQSKRLNDLAWLHINSSELPQAMDAALEAERLTRPYPRSYELAYSLMSVAGALTVTRHRDESIELSQEALKILQELQYDYTASMVLFNMMAAYQRSKQCDKAIEMSESIIVGPDNLAVSCDG
jgi:tetratricopeptide (TPR) repeat protein